MGWQLKYCKLCSEWAHAERCMLSLMPLPLKDSPRASDYDVADELWRLRLAGGPCLCRPLHVCRRETAHAGQPTG